MHIRKYVTLSALAGTMLFAQQQQAPEAKSSGNDVKSEQSSQSTASKIGESASMLGKPEQMFMMEAARGGMMEVQIAQMAQQKASSDEVKQFARQLEQDHTKANEQLKAIAQERGVSLPSDLGPHQTMVSKLNGLSGDQFDREFTKMQVQHHKKDVKEFRKQTKNGMDTDLREFATSTLPTLEQHLRQAETLASQNGTRSRTK